MKIFQSSILFETNKFHLGGPLAAGAPGQLPRCLPLNPALVVLFSQLEKRIDALLYKARIQSSS